MTLPAALQARLAKRGIIRKEQQLQANSTSQNANNDKNTNTNQPTENNETEEIIAESYDDPTEENNNINIAIQLNTGIDLEEVANCPNLSNPYHECTDYCKKMYGLKQFQPNPVMERRRIRMLKIYPLPPNWKEVADVHTNRYYYWNTETDQVSWLSPSHPKAEITMSKKTELVKHVGLEEFENTRESENDEDEEEDDDDDDDEEDDEEEAEEEDNEDDNEVNEEPVQEYSKSTRSARFEEDLDEFLSSYTSDAGNNKKSNQAKRQKKEAALDPMDPASYSDTPRGSWSQGLNTKGKNDVDDTASGPLFQMRPYPSPGQILKMNAEKK